MKAIAEAERYEAASDLAVVTSYFNPSRYATKRANYDVFRAKLREGEVPCFTIECVFGDGDFELPPGPDVFRVRARSVMFQKERLLNLAIARLPPAITKVAWLDCDVLFESPRWAVETSRLLDDCAIVQPWSRGVRLPPQTRVFDGRGRTWPSFAAVQSGKTTLPSAVFDEHGHTGFAWAARRDLLLAHGLYDRAVGGHADHLMAHAAVGDWTSGCVHRLFGIDTPVARVFRAWARPFADEVAGRLGCVDGHLLHLYHGEFHARRYRDRAREIVALGYDPIRDLKVGLDGAWEWATKKPALHEWAIAFFAERKEDETAELSRG